MRWLATTGGVPGEMVRDLMTESLEHRFGPVVARSSWGRDSSRLIERRSPDALRVDVLTAKLVVIFDRYQNQYTHPVLRPKSFDFKGFSYLH
jgi:hypothetical protein